MSNNRLPVNSKPEAKIDYQQLITQLTSDPLRADLLTIFSLLICAEAELDRDALVILMSNGRENNQTLNQLKDRIEAVLTIAQADLIQYQTEENTPGVCLPHYICSDWLSSESPVIKQSLAKARAAFHWAANNWQTLPAGNLRNHLFDWGNSYAIKWDRDRGIKTVYKRLTDLNYLLTRTAALPSDTITDLIQEYQDLAQILSGSELQQINIWLNFFRQRAHILRRGNAQWPANRILFQLAIEHADDSPITQAAEEWWRAGNCDWLWLRSLKRPEQILPDPCLRVMAGHQAKINGATMLSSGNLLSYAEDGTARIWSYDTGTETAWLNHRVHGVTALELTDGTIVSYVRRDCCDQNEAPLPEPDLCLRLWNSNGVPLGELAGHTAEIIGAKQLADGRLLSWSNDGSLRVWDVDKQELLLTMRGATNHLKDVIELPDGRLLSWPHNQSIHVWNAITGDLINCFQLYTQSELDAVTLLPNGNLITISTEDYNASLCLWNIDTGELISAQKEQSGWLRSAVILSDHRFVTWQDYSNNLSIWSSDSGALLFNLIGHVSSSDGALPLPGNRLLSWSDATPLIWDLTDQQILHKLSGHQSDLIDAMMLPDGRLLTYADDLTMRIWDIDTGKELIVLKGHTAQISGVSVLPDQRLLSWACDGTLRIWQTNFSSPNTTNKDHHESIEDTRIISNNQLLSWADNGSLCLWDLNNGAQLQSFTEGIWFSAYWRQRYGAMELTGDRLVSWSNTCLYLWDRNSGQLIHRLGPLEGDLDKRGRIIDRWQIQGIIELPNDRLLSWSHHNRLRLWDLQPGQLITELIGHEEFVYGAILLRNGRLLSWSSDKTLAIWDSETGALIHRLIGHRNAVLNARELPDGRIVSCSSDGHLRIWDSNTGYLLNIYRNHTGAVIDAMLLPDNRLLSWARRDPMMVIRDLSDDQLITTFEVEIRNLSNSLIFSNRTMLCWGNENISNMYQWIHLEFSSCERVVADEQALAVPDYRQDIDWVKDYLTEKKVTGGYLCLSQRGLIICANSDDKREHLTVWQADANEVIPYQLLADGRIIVGLDSGELHCLKLYQGNRPVSLSEFLEMMSC